VAPFPAQSQQTGGTLAGFLNRQGLAGAKLERRFGNHLFLPVSINNRRAALLIDTGSPHTVIDVNSVNSFGLTVEKTDSNVGGLFGRSWERYGTSKVKNIALGNCTVTNVPVAIADISDMNRGRSGSATGSHIADSQNPVPCQRRPRRKRDGQVWDDYRLHAANALRYPKRSEFRCEPGHRGFPG
jgi:hypothetical protein